MRHAAPLLLLCIFASAHAALQAPNRSLTDPHSVGSVSRSDAAPVPIANLFFTRGNRSADWSPDGKDVVLSTNLTGRYNLWRVAAAGSWPIQLTQSEDAQSGASWSPDGHWIAFESDRVGGEVYDLFAVPTEGGAVVNLTANVAFSSTGALWSHNGTQIAFGRKGKDAPATNVALLDMKTHSVRELTHESSLDHAWQAVAWSQDDTTLYASRFNAGFTDSTLWRIDVASAKAQELVPHKKSALVLLSAVSPDGRWLALASDEQQGHTEVALFDTNTHIYRWVTHGDWEAKSGDFSPDGKRLSYSVNADGRADVFLYHLDSGNSERVDLPAGLNALAAQNNSFSPDGRELLVSHQSSTTPGDYWIMDLEHGQRRQLTHSALASINPERIPAAQLVHYRSFDGSVISAFLWVPFNLVRDGHAPAVVLPHGGPTGQTLDSFNRTAVALASRGYVCIAPNVRGSTGYGNPFQKSNYQDLGGGDLKDEVYAARFLQDTGFVDASKIGIAGGSYGGYMAMIALGRTPQVWAAGVDLYGVTNWLSEQQHEEASLQQYDQSILGDPVKDRAVYERASATTYFAQIKAPLLILQGENDIRDPKEEAEQALKTLTAGGKTAQVHYYPGEGHGFVKRENQIDALERTVAWFDRYLKGQSVPNSP